MGQLVSWPAGALWVLSSAVVIATLMAILFVALAVAEARDRRREWASVHEFDEARRATSPRSIP